MRPFFWLTLFLIAPAALAAPCERAFLKALNEGALDPDTLEIRQLCRADEGQHPGLYVCVLSGTPPYTSQEKYGSLPLTVIYAEDDESEKHFRKMTGVWFSSSNPKKREKVAVTVNNLGTYVLKTRAKNRAASQQERFTLSFLEKNLRYESLMKTGSKSRKAAEEVFSCEKSFSQQELEEIARKKDEADKAAKALDIQGKQAVKVKPKKSRYSGITGGD